MKNRTRSAGSSRLNHDGIRRHARMPVAVALSLKGELPHRPSRSPRSQFDRLTVLPRPGQPFPRSLVQERGLFAPRRRKIASAESDRRSAGCATAHVRPRHPFARSGRIAFLVPERTLRPIAGPCRRCLVPAARHSAAGMFFASRHIARHGHRAPLSPPVRRWFPIRHSCRRARAPRD